MNHDEAMAFAEHWVKAWNDHDVEAVLAHFADDAVFTSPLATRIFPDSGGAVRGKDALRQYWNAGVRGNPALRFELLGVYAGVDTLVIRFRNEQGADRLEVLTFDGYLVRTGHGTFLASGE
ncbi:MAG TPA: nuclear transport factor 2 family protein [Trebonia sp.]|nr:nuclear transport factor 2 family protein [Trebonia sp.]